ncbi:hypothetical protein [Isoalcanivorax indicus]|uniref:hypothetical protein n=1 Tax=Isoalcanivorax indicus TaxID=2202653 RepID=UPI000DB90A50|nr:hypothetical protein [Isoalcanivorax indicus]
MRAPTRRHIIGALLGALFSSAHAFADEQTLWTLSLEGGAGWQARNNVQVPNDSSGDRFALDDITGSGPQPFFRAALARDITPQHGVRVVYAPLRVNERGTLNDTVQFAGTTFTPGAVRARYQFDAHRVTYRYTLRHTARGRLQLGGTLLVRDAEIRLNQGSNQGRDTNVGLVPLVHAAGHYQLTPDWRLAFDADALAAPQGRALDLGLRAEYRLRDDLWLHAGYRTLEGGADNDDVYTFAWFNFASAGLHLAF